MNALITLIIILFTNYLAATFIPQNEEEKRKWDLVKNNPNIAHSHFFIKVFEPLGNNTTNLTTPDDRFLITTYHDGTEDKIVIRTVAFDPQVLCTENYVANSRIACSSDSRLIAFKSSANRINIFNVETSTIITIDSTTEDPECVLFSVDGDYLMMVSRQNYLALWDLSQLEEISRYSQQSYSPIAYSTHGSFLAKNSDGLALYTINNGTLALLCSLQEYEGIAFDDEIKKLIAFSPDGRLIALPSPDKKSMNIYDIYSAGFHCNLPVISKEHYSSRSIERVAFSQSGKNIIIHLKQTQDAWALPLIGGCSPWSNHLQLWDLSSDHPLVKIISQDSVIYRWHHFVVDAIASDDISICSAIHNNYMQRLDRGSFDQYYPLEGRVFFSQLQKVWYSALGHYLFVQTVSGELWVWDSALQLSYEQLEALKELDDAGGNASGLTASAVARMNTIPYRFIQGILLRNRSSAHIFDARI